MFIFVTPICEGKYMRSQITPPRLITFNTTVKEKGDALVARPLEIQKIALTKPLGRLLDVVSQAVEIFAHLGGVAPLDNLQEVLHLRNDVLHLFGRVGAEEDFGDEVVVL